jgi:hypothetical protein
MPGSGVKITGPGRAAQFTTWRCMTTMSAFPRLRRYWSVMAKKSGRANRRRRASGVGSSPEVSTQFAAAPAKLAARRTVNQFGKGHAGFHSCSGWCRAFPARPCSSTYLSLLRRHARRHAGRTVTSRTTVTVLPVSGKDSVVGSSHISITAAAVSTSSSGLGGPMSLAGEPARPINDPPF